MKESQSREMKAEEDVDIEVSIKSWASNELKEYKAQEKLAPYVFHISLKGRYGRLNYLNSLWQIQLLALPFLWSGLLIIGALTPSFIEAMIFLIGLMLPFGLLTLRAMILRLHDLNCSGWWSLLALLLFIPIVGPLLIAALEIALSFYPGSKGDNRYGSPSKQGSLFGLLLALVTISLSIYIFVVLVGEGYIKTGTMGLLAHFSDFF
ncbi:DUF805 domain-containing protein [Ignatzschineria rhizosphaerae]|uniref:DUF805 domain-containing protein n=1 Tax=Ignatzschineria rhizosphaerae TaxID=2923279 RepID=A0ABY3WWW2_9GAMM|nr:DUF805 domain-containing protein [Ignatzschineria rhizosphaerae]UNM95097.1 DUF805 domain-containing protein [Ignatzschineria rhizosphaerae]